MTKLHSTYPMGHSQLLLLCPLLLLGSEQSLVLCKHGQLLYPATSGILHSCFHLQEMTGERPRGTGEQMELCSFLGKENFLENGDGGGS